MQRAQRYEDDDSGGGDAEDAPLNDGRYAYRPPPMAAPSYDMVDSGMSLKGKATVLLLVAIGQLIALAMLGTTMIYLVENAGYVQYSLLISVAHGLVVFAIVMALIVHHNYARWSLDAAQSYAGESWGGTVLTAYLVVQVLDGLGAIVALVWHAVRMGQCDAGTGVAGCHDGIVRMVTIVLLSIAVFFVVAAIVAVITLVMMRSQLGRLAAYAYEQGSGGPAYAPLPYYGGGGGGARSYADQTGGQQQQESMRAEDTARAAARARSPRSPTARTYAGMYGMHAAVNTNQGQRHYEHAFDTRHGWATARVGGAAYPWNSRATSGATGGGAAAGVSIASAPASSTTLGPSFDAPDVSVRGACAAHDGGGQLGYPAPSAPTVASTDRFRLLPPNYRNDEPLQREPVDPGRMRLL